MSTKIPVVVFDTCVIRNIIHDDKTVLADWDSIFIYKNKTKFHISDIAIAELALALLQNRISFNDWERKIKKINKIIDCNMPILPSGNELSALIENKRLSYPKVAGGQAYWKAVWKMFFEAKNFDTIKNGVIFKGDDGIEYKIKIDDNYANSILESERITWNKYFESMRMLFGGSNISEKDILLILNEGMDKDVSTNPSQSQIYAPMLHALARLIHLYVYDVVPHYNPKSKKRRNDPLDYSLIQSLSLPAIICTSDVRLKKMLSETKLNNIDTIILLSDLKKWLEKI
ncbi:hypothetical protein KAZ01_03805 [Candidatus Gracilibacteria bacterium]|nr:hypothetical protein [Candidatus Gracilibacteria bacterium]